MSPAPILSPLAAFSALFAAIAGPLSVHLDLLSPYTAFRAFALGTFTGSLLAVILGLWVLLRSWNQTGAPGRPLAWAGLLLGASLMLAMALAGASASKIPPIHDITTDLEDPPTFVQALEAEANRGRDLTYPHGDPKTPERQRESYSDLESIYLPLPPEQAFVQARETAEALGWEILASDTAAGRLEATQRYLLFRFVDDIVIRVRPTEDALGSTLDLRSISRDGISDLGVNAKRIRKFQETLEGSK